MALSYAAVVAVSTGNMGFQRYAVAALNPRYGGAGLKDGAGDFVTKRDGEPKPERLRCGGVVDQFAVCSADRCRRDLDPDLARSELGVRHVVAVVEADSGDRFDDGAQPYAPRLKGSASQDHTLGVAYRHPRPRGPLWPFAPYPADR